jgi:hypothetical protein
MLEMNEGDIRRTLEVQRLLVEQGEFGVPWPALVASALAERHNGPGQSNLP